MDDLLSVLYVGLEKAGKTEAVGSVFRSARIRPKTVLYLDTHDSTKTLRVPEGCEARIRQVRSLEQAEKEIDRMLAAKARARKPVCDALVIDDLSDLTERDVAEKLEGASDALRRRGWGEHLDDMLPFFWKIESKNTGAHLLCTARAFMMDVISAPKTFDAQGREKPRPQHLRPFIRGKSGPWANYQFDFILFQERKANHDNLEFITHLWPVGDIEVAHRYFREMGADKTLPRRLVDVLGENTQHCTFDALCDWVERASRVAVPGFPIVPKTIARRVDASAKEVDNGGDGPANTGAAATDVGVPVE